jgi:hypothetical protein
VTAPRTLDAARTAAISAAEGFIAVLEQPRSPADIALASLALGEAMKGLRPFAAELAAEAEAAAQGAAS